MPGNWKWTDDELRFLEANPTDWDGFRARFGADRRSRKAWQTKREERGLVGLLPTEPVPADPPDEAEWERYFSLLEDADTAKRVLTTVQQSAEFVSPEPHLPLAVVFTGDWHCGAGGVEYHRLRADLDLIAATPGCYAVGMGDWLEGVNVEVKAKSALYAGLFSEGRFQERYVVSRAEVCRGKWLAVLSGNHDEWIYKTAGITRMDQLAAALGAPWFSQGGGTIYLRVGAQEYAIGVKHNHAGKALNTTNSQRRAWDEWPEWDNMDVVCLAHLHFNDLQIASRKRQRVVYLRSGTYKVVDSYARDGGFHPEVGTPLVILLPDRKRVIPFRGDDFRLGVETYLWLRERYAREAAA